MTPGGKDEAWYYRESWLGVWAQTGALEWLKRMTGGRV
jgi:hypothetical protein